MKHTVRIIGTSHTYQVGGEDCPNEDAKEFREYILSICNDWNIRGIAEEMNIEGVKRYKGTTSIPSSVARELSMPYRACDPTTSQRKSAGIIGSGEVILDAQRNDLTKEKTAELLADEEIKREKYWLQELQDQGVWPTLFVCGATHVNRFSLLLDSAGYLARILIEDWVPSKKIRAQRSA